jgi:cytidylate kinase
VSQPSLPRVAIDGPAGAGKSTVARGLADRLGYLLLDTGALYRTVALAARRASAPWEDEAAVSELAERLVGEGAIRCARVGDGMLVSFRGEDVSLAIRAPEMSLGASRVSAYPRVRAALLAMQRSAGEEGGVVLEGRDIGTVVFPDAEVKFFLTASPVERARRRFEELTQRGQIVTLDQTLAEVIERDRADTERKVAPLRCADDAILVDSSGRDVGEIIEEMARVVEARRRP